MQTGYWRTLKTTDFEGLDPERTIAVFPVAAIEQHGPHLPLATDALINEGIVRATLEHIPADIAAVFLPPLDFGSSAEHQDFAGTLSIEPTTLLNAWLQIAKGVAGTGIRKLVILNSHGGQTAIVDLAAINARTSMNMFVVRCSYFGFGAPDGSFSQEEWTTGLHGGEIETSMMLHLHPELVQLDALDDFAGMAQEMSKQNRWLGAEKPIGFGWTARDLNPAGVSGNALRADAESGARYLAHIARSFAELIEEVGATPLSVLS